MKSVKQPTYIILLPAQLLYFFLELADYSYLTDGTSHACPHTPVRGIRQNSFSFQIYGA